MSTLIGFGEYFIFIPILIFLFSFWTIFLKLINNNNLTNTSIEKNKRVPNVNTPKQNYFFVLVECYLVGTFFLFLFFWLLRGRNSSLLFNHFVFTEFHIRVFLFFLVMSFSFYFILRVTGFSKTDYPIDFFFSLLNMVVFLPLLFCVNNFFTFLFLLELVSCFSFYKLVASKIWYKKHLIESPLITSESVAKALADFILSKLSDPIPIISISTSLDPTMQVGDRIRLSSVDQLDIANTDYWITGIQMQTGSGFLQTMELRRVT